MGWGDPGLVGARGADGMGMMTVGFSISHAPCWVRRTQASLSLRAQLLSQQCGSLWPAVSPHRGRWWRWPGRPGPARPQGGVAEPHGPHHGTTSVRQELGIWEAVDFWEASCLRQHSPTGARVGPSAVPGVSAALKHPSAAGRCRHGTSIIVPLPRWEGYPKKGLLSKSSGFIGNLSLHPSPGNWGGGRQEEEEEEGCIHLTAHVGQPQVKPQALPWCRTSTQPGSRLPRAFHT